jgi:hypothetical protein
VNFVDAEAGLILRRSTFVDAGWVQPPPDDHGRRFRVRLNDLEVRFDIE